MGDLRSCDGPIIATAEPMWRLEHGRREVIAAAGVQVLWCDRREVPDQGAHVGAVSGHHRNHQLGKRSISERSDGANVTPKGEVVQEVAAHAAGLVGRRMLSAY
jgi:hypothetical protein